MTTCHAFTRYKGERPPRCNCEACWTKYFYQHTGKYLALFRAITEVGREKVEPVVGTKFLKHFERFMNTYGQRISEAIRLSAQKRTAKETTPSAG